MPAWLAPAIGGAASLIGSGINSLFSSNQASKTRASNMRLAEYQYSKDKEMWNTANEYNSPTKQMERLKAGGLNPNLVYGNGSVVGNTSTATPSQSVPDMSARGKLNVDLPNPLMALNQFQDLKNKSVQHDNLSVQTKLMEKESEIKTLEQLKIMSTTGKNQAETNRLNGLYESQLQKLEEEARGAKLKTNMLQLDHENYSKYGIRPNDSIMYRGGAKIYEQFKDWMKSVKKTTGAMKQGKIDKPWNYAK